MIADWDTDTVLVSDLLQQRHPKIERELRRILQKHNVPMLTIEGTKDIWIRDYAPLQIQSGQFLQFRYHPDYLLDGYEHSITKPSVFRSLPFIRERRLSRLILDGGNVVATQRTAILANKIDRENPKLTPSQIQSRLTELLNVERLIVIPKEPYDDIGHSDGMVRFLTDDTIVVNDYRKMSPTFAKRLEATLIKADLRLMRLPYRPELKKRAGIASAVGNYANFLRVGNLVIIPEFGRKQDQEVQRLMAAWLPNAKLETLRCKALAQEGGVLNCVTWTIQTRTARTQRRSNKQPATVFLAEGHQRRPLLTSSKPEPCVGIWWHNAETIVAVVQPLRSFAPDRQLIDSNLGHVHEWPLVATALDQSSSVDYFIVPRGRVLFDRQRETGFIYHGNHTGRTQLQRIAKLFGLSDWEAPIDDHYLMNDAADELFNE